VRAHGPTAKSAALKSRTVEIISDFYNSHDLKLGIQAASSRSAA
jgi:hypothetical protein